MSEPSEANAAFRAKSDTRASREMPRLPAWLIKRLHVISVGYNKLAFCPTWFQSIFWAAISGLHVFKTPDLDKIVSNEFCQSGFVYLQMAFYAIWLWADRLVACVAGVWKGREREFSRFPPAQNPLSLPFQTPATQANRLVVENPVACIFGNVLR